jgi:Sigma-70, region 4
MLRESLPHGQDRCAAVRSPLSTTPRPGVVTGLVDRPRALDGPGPAQSGPGSGLTGASVQPLSAPLPDDTGPIPSLTPDEHLRAVVARLSRAHELSASAGMDCQPMGSVLVFRPWPARALHVVGQSPLAGEFRRLITSGAAPGWHLHPAPPGRTPLDVLAGPLLRRTGSRRFYTILDLHGFAYVEEVAATPDACLLELRNSGPRLIAAVRAVIRELGPADAMVGTAGTSGASARGRGRAPAGTPAPLPPDLVAAVQVIAAWGIAERGARTLEDLLTPSPAAAGMPPDVARCWDRLAQFGLRPLAGPAAPDANMTRLAAELLGETDPRRRLILTSRTFAPHQRTYDSLARELGISRERVRQLEDSALAQLTRAARDHRYAPLRWRAASTVRPGPAVPAAAADAPPWMGKLMSWLASKTR